MRQELGCSYRLLLFFNNLPIFAPVQVSPKPIYIKFIIIYDEKASNLKFKIF